MANNYIDNASPSPADPYGTWNSAGQAMSTVAAACSVDEPVYVASGHAESAAGQTITFPGTRSQPNDVLCGTKNGTGDGGISALATGAVITTTAGFTVNGSFRMHGVTFRGTGSTTQTYRLAADPATQLYESCSFLIENTTATPAFNLGENATGENSIVTFRACTFRFGNAAIASSIGVSGQVYVMGGVLHGSTAAIVSFMRLGRENRGGNAEIESFNFTGAAGAFYVFNETSTGSACRGVVRNCKLPASWSGDVIDGWPLLGSEYIMVNCAVGDTHYTFRKKTNAGRCAEETSIVRTTGGFVLNGTTVSMRVEASEHCSKANVFRSLPLTFPIQVAWLGNAKVATIEIAHDDDAGPISDALVWMELQHPGTSGSPLGVVVTDQAAAGSVGAAQASSAIAWNGDSGTGPNGGTTWHTLKLSVSFTPQELGNGVATICIARTGTVGAPAKWTFFADPQVTVT